MDVRTTRFGDLETVSVSSEAVFTFAEGVPGFERHTSFALLDDDRISPFRCLQSLDDPDLGFLVLEPSRFVEEYGFDLCDEDAARLELDEDPSTSSGQAAPLVLTILVIPGGDVRAMTANLQAPVVLNPRRRLGKQVILAEERFPLRHPVFGAAQLATVGG